MDTYDFTVIGEVCLDYLEKKPPRPGGAFYSAYAGRQLGAKTTIVGHMGNEDEKLIVDFLEQYEIPDKYLQRVPGPTTRYMLYHVDEVLPLSVNFKKNRYPIKMPNTFPISDVVLFYPYLHLDTYINQYSDSLKGLDVQYDIDLVLGLENLSQIDILFISTSDVLSYTKKSFQEILDLFFKKGVKIIVTKFGQGGSSIYRQKESRIDIPSFQSNYQFTVGAGDVFNAVFLVTYHNTKDLELSGLSAAAAASVFIESFDFRSTPWNLQEEIKSRRKQFIHPEQAQKIKIYLAGPFFSDGERYMVSQTYHALKKCGFSLFSPWHEDGIVPRLAVKSFKKNINAIKEATLIVALLDYEDPGTVWECGYAYALNKPIYAIQTCTNSFNLMVNLSTELTCESLRCLIDYLYEKYGKVK
ncbi:MAG TPA: hypothetical protein GXX19_10725 [Syntrophomonadaceae bacterium]|nr:hypothetical protein [Syntrophomonadaceae bacterium]